MAQGPRARKLAQCQDGQMREVAITRLGMFFLGSVAHNIPKFLPTQITGLYIDWPVPAFGHFVERLGLNIAAGISGMISVHHFKSPLR